MVGKDGFNKQGFVNALGKFAIATNDPGVYKLEIFHHHFNFEPVIVDVNPSGQEHEYSAYLF